MKKAPRRKLIAYASTGTHCGPWVRNRDDVPGMTGSLAIFETYKAALKDSCGPSFVHRVEMFIDDEWDEREDDWDSDDCEDKDEREDDWDSDDCEDKDEWVFDCGDAECCMNFAPHFRSECYTPEMYEDMCANA